MYCFAGSTEQVVAHHLLSWQERLGTSHHQLTDSVVDGLRLNAVNYREPVRSHGPLYGRANKPGSSRGGPHVWPPLTGSDRPRWPQPPRYNAEGSEINSLMPGSKEAEAAIEWYRDLKDDPWLLLTTLVSDATTTCPALASAARVARTLSHAQPQATANVPVYAYVSRHARVSRAGTVADGLSDIESILGVFQPENEEDIQYARTIQDFFFLFIRTGSPEWHSMTPAHLGIYVINEKVTVERTRIQCEHWTNSSHLIRRF